MGRKKSARSKKQDDEASGEPVAAALPAAVLEAPHDTTNKKDPVFVDAADEAPKRVSPSTVDVAQPGAAAPPKSSGYSMTSHSAEIVAEDLYMSDGSDDEEMGPDPAGEEPEVVLAHSRMGLMRRGLHHPSLLLQPNRQWQRASAVQVQDGELVDGDGTADDDTTRAVEEELAKLDPAQRAARLLAEKQRKLEEAKVTARRLESEENAGRDPCLFSKRTAFDIRMDQIDDKPWLRGAGELTDFFNYSLTEDDWLEYSQQQLMIRQEMTDANRQKRPPDPNIVPVSQRAPRTQNPRVAVVTSSNEKGMGNILEDDDDAVGAVPVMGPAIVKPEDTDPMDVDVAKGPLDEKEESVKDEGAGGAWGAGAAPGSKLARLIEEQERGVDVAAKAVGNDMKTHDDQRSHQYGGSDAVSQEGRPGGSRGSYDHADSYEYRSGGGGYAHQSHEQYPPSRRGPPDPQFPPQHYGGRGPPPPPYGYGGRGAPPPPYGYGGGRGRGLHSGWGQGGGGRDFPPPSRKQYRDDYRR